MNWRTEEEKKELENERGGRERGVRGEGRIKMLVIIEWM